MKHQYGSHCLLFCAAGTIVNKRVKLRCLLSVIDTIPAYLVTEFYSVVIFLVNRVLPWQ